MPEPYPQFKVPASQADLTAKWLEQALSATHPGVSVEGLAIEPIGQDYGLASQIFRCRWAGDGALRRVVVKLWAADGPAGIREVPFYQTFGKELTGLIPTYYHASLDLDKQRGVLILEDLVGASQGDDLQQLPLPQAELLARAFAGIHATCLNHKALADSDWLPSAAVWDRDADWFAPRRALFLERFGDRLDDKARQLLHHIEQAQAVSNARLADAPVTLIHEDLHLDNVVFGRDGRPVILDWARCASGPLALDLYELLFRMGQPEHRTVLLQTYLTEFGSHSGYALSPDLIWRQLGGVALRKFSTNTCGIANWQPATEREAALIDISIQRTLDALRFWSDFDPALFSFLNS